MAYNKVVYDGNTLIDLTQDDVTPSDVKSGVYFHGADGVRTQGTLVEKTLPIGSIYESVTNTNPSSDLGNTWEYLGTSYVKVSYGIETSGGDALYTSDGYNLVTSDFSQETYKFVRTA